MVTLLLLTLNNLSCTRKYLKNIKYLNVSGDWYLAKVHKLRPAATKLAHLQKSNY